MSLLAHLSDLHLLERDHHKRRGLARQRLAFLSTGSPLDAEKRMQRTAATLHAARRAGADHYLITGDLTEDGSDSQFEVLADVLAASKLDPDCVTLVPGNHDGYSDSTAFQRALAGPLRAFQRTSGANARTILPEAVITPISTVVEHQWFTHSRGVIRDEDVLSVRRLASDRISRDRAIVVAQHHPPSHHPVFAMEWIDGVKNAVAMRELLLERTRVHVLHGHTHKLTTKRFSGRSHGQVFSTGSVRDEFERGLALRMYKAEEGTLRELTAAV
ncbi:MAG TPA: metallophosphoesterase, partial [Polyangiales bacterium]|nr:metallophosphoesterase [Polyangiales bacterium]